MVKYQCFLTLALKSFPVQYLFNCFKFYFTIIFTVDKKAELILSDFRCSKWSSRYYNIFFETKKDNFKVNLTM